MKTTANSSRRGFILLIVLVVILLTSMVAASLLFVLSAEHTAAAAGNSGEQARSVAMSAIYQAMRVASDATPGSLDWQDNPSLFQDQLVDDDGAVKWYFSVYSVTDSETSPIAFGLSDEGGKINVYNAAEATLEALPNMTAPLAQSLLAAAGANLASVPMAASTNDPAAIGALTDPLLPDTSVYDSSTLSNTAPPLPPQWTCVDELLQIPGFNAQLLYGSYTNYSGRVDTRIEVAGADSQVQPGLCQYVTVSSYDWNLDNQGQPRINLQDTNADLSKLSLPQTALDYIAALGRANLHVTNVVDLLEASNSLKTARGRTTNMISGIGKNELPVLLDRCTTTNASKLVGLVNINTASAKVLAALPGMSDTLAEAIVSARVGLSPEARQTPAWLYQEGVMNAATFKKVAPLLTTRSCQFHFFVAAYTVPAAAFRVFEVVIDTGVKPARILSMRDVSRLGMPFTPGVDASQPSDSPDPSGGAADSQGVSVSGAPGSAFSLPIAPQRADRGNVPTPVTFCDPSGIRLNSPIGDFS